MAGRYFHNKLGRSLRNRRMSCMMSGLPHSQKVLLLEAVPDPCHLRIPGFLLRRSPGRGLRFQRILDHFLHLGKIPCRKRRRVVCRGARSSRFRRTGESMGYLHIRRLWNMFRDPHSQYH